MVEMVDTLLLKSSSSEFRFESEWGYQERINMCKICGSNDMSEAHHQQELDKVRIRHYRKLRKRIKIKKRIGLMVELADTLASNPSA